MIVGSGPGVPSEVKVYQVPLAIIVEQPGRRYLPPSSRMVTIDQASPSLRAL